jgi:protein TonB
MKKYPDKPESFDDIVFEHRNKDYGAYELRKSYSKRGNIAMTIAMFIVFVMVGLPLLSNLLNRNEQSNWIEQNTLVEFITIKDRIDVPPIPEIPDAPVDVKQVKFRSPEIVDSLSNDDDIIATNDDLLKNSVNKPVDTTSVNNYVYDDKDDFKTPDDDTHDIIDLSEKPMFPGGDGELFKYIVEHVVYPTQAQETGIQGTVYIRFVVTKTGKVGETQVYKAADPLLNEAAVDVIKSMPDWSPGKINGNPVNSWFIVPIKFKLEE